MEWAASPVSHWDVGRLVEHLAGFGKDLLAGLEMQPGDLEVIALDGEVERFRLVRSVGDCSRPRLRRPSRLPSRSAGGPLIRLLFHNSCDRAWKLLGKVRVWTNKVRTNGGRAAPAGFGDVVAKLNKSPRIWGERERHHLKQRNFRKICSILCIALLSAPVLPARTDWVVCGTERGNEQELHLSRMASAHHLGPADHAGAHGNSTARPAHTRRRRPGGDRTARRRRDLRATPSDLVGRSLTFAGGQRREELRAVRGRARLRFRRPKPTAPSSPIWATTTTGAVPLPFDFNYYGRTHSQILVHSDGNVTLIGLMLLPPRVPCGPPGPRDRHDAPLFADLDPTIVNCDVRVWTGEGPRGGGAGATCPNTAISGTGSRQYVQVALYTNGHHHLPIRQAWPAASWWEFPLADLPAGQTDVISLPWRQFADLPGVVAESFGSANKITPSAWLLASV